MGNLKPQEQFLKGGQQPKLHFDKRGRAELQRSRSVLGLFVILFFIMLGRQLNRNLALIILKATCLSSKILLSFDCQKKKKKKMLGRSLLLFILTLVSKRGGEVGHLTLLLLRWRETVGEIEGEPKPRMGWQSVGEQCVCCCLWLHVQIMCCRSAAYDRFCLLAFW